MAVAQGAVLVQGGYYEGAAALVALLVAVAAGALALTRRKSPALSPADTAIPLLLAGSALLVGIMALASGTTLSKIAAIAPYAALAAGCAFGFLLTLEERNRLLCAYAWCGVAIAAISLVLFTGIIAVEGFTNAGRLQSFFQYANTAGAWYGVIAVLALASDDKRLRWLALLPLLCVALTQSGGAILSLLAAAAVALPLMHRQGRSLPESFPLIALVLIVGILAAGGLFFPSRIEQAAQTLIERFVQMADAAALLCSNPLGIGPGQWRYTYPYAQTAQYTASILHCGYLQLALDGGLLALVAFGAALFLSLRKAWQDTRPTPDGGEKAESLGPTLALVLLAVHSLIDIDLKFGAIALLMGLLMAPPLGSARPKGKERTQAKASTHQLPGATAAIIALLVAASLGAASFAACVYKQNILASLANATTDSSMELAESAGGLTQDDPEVQYQLLYACLIQGSYEEALTFAGEHGLPTTQAQTLALAECHYGLGNQDEAEDLLLDELERTLYSTAFFDAVREEFLLYGASEEATARYNELAAEANNLIHTGHAALLDNQEEIELLA